MQSLRVIVAQLGARHNYAVARMLYMHRALVALYTDLCLVGPAKYVVDFIPDGWSNGLAGRLRRRFVRDVPARLVWSAPGINVRTWLGRRSEGVVSYRRHDQLFAEAMLRWGLRDANMVYAMFGNGQAFLEYAKTRGLKIAVEVFVTPVEHRIQAAERAQFPEWEPPVPIDHTRLDTKVTDVIRLADILICPSESVTEGLRQYPNFVESKVRLVPYACSMVYPRPNRPVAGRILFAGSGTLRKGIHYLAQAARALTHEGRRYEFRVAGAVTERVRYRPEATPLSFLGQLSKEEMIQELLSADVLVLPSVAEGSATVVCEALAAGVPVVTTRSAGSVVSDRVEGLIVAERDHKGLASAIATIVENRDLRDRMAKAALATAAGYDESHWAERLVEALHSV